MKLLGNIIWWLFGGIATALEYLSIGLLLCITIIGIPFGIQCFKMALVSLLPFGSKVSESHSGLLGMVGNIIWMLTGGLLIGLTHLLFGILLCITIIGIPFGRKHFMMMKIAFTPFGRDISFEF